MTGPTDFAWAAGFFDGEGCVHIHRDVHRVDARRASYKLHIQVSGRNRDPLDQYARLFGGRVRPFYKRAYPRVPYFEWNAFGQRACEALDLLLPYLVGKKAVATLAVEFQHWYVSTKTQTKAMPAFRKDRAEVYKAECHRLVRLHRQPNLKVRAVALPPLQERAAVGTR
jgi:hypothetical protein